MKNTVNPHLIKQFRDKVNDNRDFILNKYLNDNGRNKWHIICSCMDWITVAVNYLSEVQNYHSDIDVRSMQVYTYISSIDIVWESIKQLHRVFINPKTIPFKGQSTIFVDSHLNDKDDNNYFKQIRAAFGAHPVNLRDNDEEWVASWPVRGSLVSKNFDFCVFLYNKVNGKKDITFGLHFDELNKFLYERYSYLHRLMQKIDFLYKNFKLSFKDVKIKESKDIVGQLYILKEEANQRFNNDYYMYIISNLISIFENTINCQTDQNYELKYKENLTPLINEIYTNLQVMNFDDLKFEELVNLRLASEFPFSYEINKLYCLLPDEVSDWRYKWYIDRINGCTNGEILLSENDPPGVTYLKLNLLVYFNLWEFDDKNGISPKRK